MHQESSGTCACTCLIWHRPTLLFDFASVWKEPVLCVLCLWSSEPYTPRSFRRLKCPQHTAAMSQALARRNSGAQAGPSGAPHTSMERTAFVQARS